jgi:hypothetical protein
MFTMQRSEGASSTVQDVDAKDWSNRLQAQKYIVQAPRPLNLQACVTSWCIPPVTRSVTC